MYLVLCILNTFKVDFKFDKKIDLKLYEVFVSTLLVILSLAFM